MASERSCGVKCLLLLFNPAFLIAQTDAKKGKFLCSRGKKRRRRRRRKKKLTKVHSRRRDMSIGSCPSSSVTVSISAAWMDGS
jgi:hypothetical protein